MRRREFMALLGGLFALPLTANAQQASVPVIGLSAADHPMTPHPTLLRASKGLKAFGYVDGRTVSIAYRWARGDYPAPINLGISVCDLVSVQ
jgi:putative ABC transport system substrate-binding protein